MTLKEIIQQAVERTMAMGVPASQSRLAEKMGVARATISLWILGRAFPSAEHIAKLADLSGVSQEEAEDALWAAKRGRWTRRYRAADGAHGGRSYPRRDLAKAHRGRPAHAHRGAA